jgi:ATP-dependent Zn protease
VELDQLHGTDVVTGPGVDAFDTRERARQRRLWRLLLVTGLPLSWFWWRELSGNPVRPGLPQIVRDSPEIWISVGLMLMLMAMVLLPFLGAGRSPHVVLRPSDSQVHLADVIGAEGAKREVVDTLNLFLSHRTFAETMGGTPRHGVLFEGPPGTGKTHLAKAMAAEANVPFLFVSASAFQSMYYGQTNRKIRTYFKALRKAARAEGGAIGFIEEFDAIGGARSGMNTGSMREGIVGVVNELLVQMQSFDIPTSGERVRGALIDAANRLLPPHRALRRPSPQLANILVIAATNRAADLDPALLRPGRFDRVIHFDLPPRTDRRAIAEYYLGRKAHTPAVTPDVVADLSAGYTPVRIERLLDEALIIAVRHGRRAMSHSDVLQAQLITDVGLAQDVGYPPAERRRIAVHEAGHALVATLVGRDVRVASILRRSESLGLVAHGDADEHHLRTPGELRDLMDVALAGRAAEMQEYGDASSGIAADLAAATQLASQMVGSLGMGEGLLSLEAAVVPGAGNLAAKVLADDVSREAAEAMLRESAERAALLVEEHRDRLFALADALLLTDELTGDDVRRIVRDADDARVAG